MATLLKALSNLADIKSAGVLHFASELRVGSVHLMMFVRVSSAASRNSM